jgi:hypothetical protein
MLFPRARQVLADSARQEQDHHDGCRDPERPVEVWVALEDIEEVLAGVESGAAAGEDLVGVDIEELLVKSDAPGWLEPGAPRKLESGWTLGVRAEWLSNAGGRR